MLLFRPEHVPMILSGRKWQTRRLWPTPRVKVGSIQKCYSGGMPFSKCKTCDGRRHAGQWDHDHYDGFTTPCELCHGSGLLPPFAHIRILQVWQHTLSLITDEDIQAEGYFSWREYMEAFGRINHIKVPIEEYQYWKVWALAFKLVEAANGAPA